MLFGSCITTTSRSVERMSARTGRCSARGGSATLLTDSNRFLLLSRWTDEWKDPMAQSHLRVKPSLPAKCVRNPIGSSSPSIGDVDIRDSLVFLCKSAFLALFLRLTLDEILDGRKEAPLHPLLFGENGRLLTRKVGQHSLQLDAAITQLLVRIGDNLVLLCEIGAEFRVPFFAVG